MSLADSLAMEGALSLIVHAAPLLKDDWWVIGSAAALLHGASAGPVRDVDLLVSRRDGERLLAIWSLSADPPGSDGLFRSSLHAHKATPGLAIDIMADLECNAAGIWHRIAPRSRQRIGRVAHGVYVPSVPELIEMLTLFGRDKDLARAAVLRDLQD